MLIKYTDRELDLLARLMRSEALGEGNLGMLMVGNVVVNRVVANCHTFVGIKTIYDAIYQENAFVGTNSSLFQSASTTLEKELARRVLQGEYYYPATHCLWFYSPGNNPCRTTWYDQPYSGKYKNHCFYRPKKGVCTTLY